MVSEIGFSEVLSLAQTIGTVGTMILTLYFSKEYKYNPSRVTRILGFSKMITADHTIRNIEPDNKWGFGGRDETTHLGGQWINLNEHYDWQ